jgi:hypothetical protein
MFKCHVFPADTIFNGAYVPEWHSLVVSFADFKMKQHCNNILKKFKNIDMAFYI